jgi:hypothetical protein
MLCAECRKKITPQEPSHIFKREGFVYPLHPGVCERIFLERLAFRPVHEKEQLLFGLARFRKPEELLPRQYQA